MENNKNEVAKVQFKLKLPKARGSKEFFEITINDIDEVTYTMARSLVKADKEHEAVKLILQELHAGGDNIEEVLKCFWAVLAASSAILELLTPAEVELKKN
jgi:hypothetical protein